MRAKVHFYSADTIDRQAVHAYLGIAGFLFAYLVDRTTNQFNLTIPWWVDAPSTLGYYGLFYLLFKTYLWKMPFFRWVFRLKTPNWNGAYSCSMQTSYDGFTSTQDITVTIKQDWDTISVKTETQHSSSASLSGSFSIDNNVDADFTYEYENQPNAAAPNTMNIHKGMATINFTNGKLNGEFFTGRGRQTFGTFKEK